MKILVLVLLLSLKTYSQQILKPDEIIAHNDTVYRKVDSLIFTGKVQSLKRNGNPRFEAQFLNGILLKTSQYYNTSKSIISEEKFYNHKRFVMKRIKYSENHDILWTTTFNDKGDKILEEDFKDGITIYRCPYENKKKHGNVFSIDKEGKIHECEFFKGKLIK